MRCHALGLGCAASFPPSPAPRPCSTAATAPSQPSRNAPVARTPIFRVHPVHPLHPPLERRSCASQVRPKPTSANVAVPSWKRLVERASPGTSSRSWSRRADRRAATVRPTGRSRSSTAKTRRRPGKTSSVKGPSRGDRTSSNATPIPRPHPSSATWPRVALRVEPACRFRPLARSKARRSTRPSRVGSPAARLPIDRTREILPTRPTKAQRY